MRVGKNQLRHGMLYIHPRILYVEFFYGEICYNPGPEIIEEIF